MGYIYGLYDPRTGELRYVGKTKHTPRWRLRSHLCPSSRARHTKLSRWLGGLHNNGLVPCIDVLEQIEESLLNTRECHWIAGLRGTGHRLLNGTNGGDGAAYWTGKKRSAETVAKIAAKLRGRKLSAAQRTALCGRVFSVEHRAKLAAASRGRTHTPAVRKRLAEKARLQGIQQNNAWRKDIDGEFVFLKKKEGWSFRKIATTLQTDHHTVKRHLESWCRKQGIFCTPCGKLSACQNGAQK